jgi:hypothetical protein
MAPVDYFRNVTEIHRNDTLGETCIKLKGWSTDVWQRQVKPARQVNW